MKKALTLAFVIAVGAAGAYLINREAEALNSPAPLPFWLENDSVRAIQTRIKHDFCLNREQLLKALNEKYPNISDNDIDRYLALHYLESVNIDGEQKFFRKSARNFGILNPIYGEPFTHRGASASDARISYVDSVLAFYANKNNSGLSHKVLYRFSIDVPGDTALLGDTLRVWMPLPLEGEPCPRQNDVKILNTEPAYYILSDGRSVHNTIYFEAPAPAPEDTAHFEYIGSFVTSGQYRSESEILASIRPYNTQSDIYLKNTVFDNRHIVRLDSLAKTIVESETNPFRQSELVYDYIVNNYPWAGAREYSTLECIPEYVIKEKHGDCGQVALLYISLMRTLGIPARWESGWMLHPGEVNLHDWAEVYFEGVGWLPVDVSFGRYSRSDNDAIKNFYSHGIDSHRFASNKGIGGELFPAKKYLRSETVDFQLGEVECSRGNLYYPAWDSNLEIISYEPIVSESR